MKIRRMVLPVSGVYFKKQDKPESKRKLQEETDAVAGQFSNNIDTVKNNRESKLNTYSPFSFLNKSLYITIRFHTFAQIIS